MLRAIHLNVGGVHHTTSLGTLLAHPGSRLYDMFVGLMWGSPPCFPLPSAFESEDIKEMRKLQQPLPRESSSSETYVLDRDGSSFRYILNYLRGGDDAELPPARSGLQQLAAEARFFGLDKLAARCESPLTAFIQECGFGVTCKDIAALSEDALDLLFKQQKINFMRAAEIKRALAAGDSGTVKRLNQGVLEQQRQCSRLAEG